MKTVLLTAFEPYGTWKTNASELCLRSIEKTPIDGLIITTRLYPVDFAKVPDLIAQDLEEDYDFVIHLGQAPGRNKVCLERVAINVGEEPERPEDDPLTLCEDGALAYCSSLPLVQWAREARQEELPVQVSHHAGTYLCNATLYWTHYFIKKRGLKAQSCFVHLPLCEEHFAEVKTEHFTMSGSLMLDCLIWILTRLTSGTQKHSRSSPVG